LNDVRNVDGFILFLQQLVSEHALELKLMSGFVNKVRARVKQFLPSGKFARSVTLLAGGTAFAQALVILASPVLTRFYSPESFGVLAVFSSILSTLIVVASLRYEMAIPLHEDDKVAVNLLALSLMIVIVVSLITALGVSLLRDRLVVWINAPALAPYLGLLPVGVFAVGSYQVFNYWTSRKKRFSVISLTKATQAVGQVTIQVLGGILETRSLGLIIGYIAGQFLGLSSFLRKAELPVKSIHPKEWLIVARLYKNFPLYTLWASLINVIGLQAPAIMLTMFFSLETTGFFSLTMRVLGVPAAIVGQAIGQVFYPMAADLRYESKALKEFIEKVATVLITISLPIFSLVALNGPELFGLFFGSKWQPAGQYAQYLAPWLIFSFVSSPLSMFVFVMGKQKNGLFFTVYETSLRLGAIYLGGSLSSPLLAIALYAGGGLLISLVYIGWVLRLSGSGFFHWIGKIQGFVLSGTAIVVLLFIVKFFIGPIGSLVASICVLVPFGVYSSRGMFRGTANA